MLKKCPHAIKKCPYKVSSIENSIFCRELLKMSMENTKQCRQVTELPVLAFALKRNILCWWDDRKSNLYSMLERFLGVRETCVYDSDAGSSSCRK